MQIESHPLPPFLPENARILFSGSFPPPASRWCMDWFYPNFQNDMWRIIGYIATGDKNHFIAEDGKRFDKKRLVDFCTTAGLAFSDTGEEAVRLKNNASDKFLQVVTPRDFNKLLAEMPHCHTIALTGEKAMETLGAIVGYDKIKLGEYVETDHFLGRKVKIWRMPSSSRAYPRPIEWKADYYRKALLDAGINF